VDGAPFPTTAECTRTTDGESCGVQPCGVNQFRELCCSADGACTVVCGVCAE
jgi:hypothetical protein